MQSMNLELSDTETAAIIHLLRHAIDEDRYASRIACNPGELSSTNLEPWPPASLHGRVYAPPTKGRWRPRRG